MYKLPQLLGVCINFKDFQEITHNYNSTSTVTSTISSSHIIAIFKAPSCGFNFQYVIISNGQSKSTFL